MFKYKIVILFLMVIVLSSLNFVHASELPLFNKIIYLDAGHGGADPGAMYKDLKESDINMSIVKKLEEELVKRGAVVYLTRNGDYDLSKPKLLHHKRNDLNQRIKMINSSNEDIYISIHLNSETSSAWRGAQVFFDDVNKENKKIADLIQNQFKEKLNSNREVKELKNIYLIRSVNIPGVLIEAGFLSNPNERYLLRQESYQRKIAEIISDSIELYLCK